jgi:hypothetical protein
MGNGSECVRPTLKTGMDRSGRQSMAWNPSKDTGWRNGGNPIREKGYEILVSEMAMGTCRLGIAHFDRNILWVLQ